MYSSLALAYRQWHYRMTTVQTEQSGGPAIGFSALQLANAFSLLILLPPGFLPKWLFVGALFLVGAISFHVVSRIYRSHPASFRYAKLTDNVPPIKEFPAVYSYLLGSLAFLAICISVAIDRAA